MLIQLVIFNLILFFIVLFLEMKLASSQTFKLSVLSQSLMEKMSSPKPQQEVEKL